MIAFAGGLLTGRPPALADHGAVQGAPAPQRSFARSAEPQTAMGVDLSMTSFAIAGVGGTFYTVAGYGEYWHGAVGAQVRVPVHTLAMDGGGDGQTGLGDVMVGASWIAAASDRASIGLGVDGYLPSGDSDAGMGAGTLALAPNARGAVGLFADLALHATAGAILNTSAGEETSFVDQRADTELRFAAAVAWQPSRWRLVGQTSVAVPLAPVESRGELLVTAGPQVAVEIDHHWSLLASAELSLREQRAYDWRAGVAVGYAFAHDHPD